MPFYRLQVITKTVSGLPEDYATNTLYIEADDDVGAEEAMDEIAARYITFSTNQPSSVVGVLGGLTIKAYDMADAEPREPIETKNYALTPVNAEALPTEVALVVSFRAQYESGVKPASRRGRIYLPFLTETGSENPGRPSAALIAAAAALGAGILSDSIASPAWTWKQYSPTLNAYNSVQTGFVNNEWDTQRRRGRKATARTIFP